MPHVLFHHVDPAPKGGYTELPVSSHSSSWKPTSTGEDWDDEADEGVCGGGCRWVWLRVCVCTQCMCIHCILVSVFVLMCYFTL